MLTGYNILSLWLTVFVVLSMSSYSSLQLLYVVFVYPLMGFRLYIVWSFVFLICPRSCQSSNLPWCLCQDLYLPVLCPLLLSYCVLNRRIWGSSPGWQRYARKKEIKLQMIHFQHAWCRAGFSCMINDIFLILIITAIILERCSPTRDDTPFWCTMNAFSLWLFINLHTVCKNATMLLQEGTVNDCLLSILVYVSMGKCHF